MTFRPLNSQNTRRFAFFDRKIGHGTCNIKQLFGIFMACASIFYFLEALTTTTPLNAQPRHDDTDASYTSCLKETLRNLPISKDGQVRAHHWDAGNEQWNENIRFDPMPRLQQEPCSVWEVGAHTRAQDTQRLRSMYPLCEYHAYEPISDFFKELTDNWRQDGAGNANVHLHNYALAKENGTIYFPKSSLAGQSTYIGDGSKLPDSTNDVDSDSASVRSFHFAVQDAGGNKPTLLHMNCEGCEWDLLRDALDTSFIDNVPLIQIGFHNYGHVGLGERVIEYCDIQMKLARTHNLVHGAVPFAWERWELK